MIQTATLRLHPKDPNSLSKREQEVKSLILEGLKNREIAEALFISEKTVKFHLTNMYRKLGFTTSRRIRLVTTFGSRVAS